MTFISTKISTGFVYLKSGSTHVSESSNVAPYARVRCNQLVRKEMSTFLISTMGDFERLVKLLCSK